MTFLISVVLTIFFMVSTAPVKAEQLRPKRDDMVEHFLKVVFGKEYDFATSSGILSKWKAKRINIILQGRPTQEMANYASRHLGVISKLTKIKFKQATPQARGPSIDIIFVKRSEMGKIKIPNTDPSYIRTLAADPTMVCYFLAWHQPPEVLIKAIVVVNNEKDPKRVGSCLLEELTQVMGLPNDAQTYWKTLFNPLDVSFQHSPWDMLYLKTLYDPRLKAGMTPAQARPVLRKIFGDVLARKSKP